MFQWLNPVLLYGLAGAGVPLIIHLIQRKRAPQHEFPAVRLLMQARRRIRSRLRLRHLLVMLLRMILILLLAAALARPYLRSAQALALSEDPTACLILLDDTLSMRYRPGGGGESLFDRARGQARRTLSRLREFDRARVVTFSGRRVGPQRFSGEHDALSRALEETEAGYAHHRAAPLLQRVLRVLEEAELPEKRLILLSDLTRSSWEPEDFELLARVPGRVRAPGLGAEEEVPSNRHVADASVEVSDGRLQVVLAAQSTGPRMQEGFPVALRLDGEERVRRTVSVRDGRATTRLRAEAKGRRFVGKVALPEDPLPADNVFHLTGRSSARPRVLLVDGDPRESIYRSESFYLDLALRAEGSRVRARTVTRETLAGADLEGYDCVVLANVPADSLPPAGRIRTYLQGGGSLWVILGDQIRPGELRRSLGPLLPALPRSVGEAGGQEDGPARLSTENLDHPIFGALERRWTARFAGAAFRRWWLLAPRPGARIPMRLENEAPVLVENRGAGGHVLVMAGPLDRDWNDLCIQPVFVPFVQQTVRYLAGSLTRPGERLLRVGQSFRLDLLDPPETLYLRRPDSDRWEELALERASDPPQAVVADTARPGIYRIARREAGEGLLATFAVNPHPAASDLRRLSRRKLTRLLVRAESRRPATGTRSGAGRPLWSILLWAAVGVMVIESVLARR